MSDLDEYLTKIGNYVVSDRQKGGLLADDLKFLEELKVRMKELFPAIIVGLSIPAPDDYTGPGNFLCDLDPPPFSEN